MGAATRLRDAAAAPPAAARAHRRQPLHPDITEGLIEHLVRDFYARVRCDAELGPIFERVITDWEPHLRTMMDFWSSVTARTGRFHGQPMRKHIAIPGLAPAHFSLWLRLFRESALSVLSPEIATIFIDQADRIAESLQRGIARSRAGQAPI